MISEKHFTQLLSGKTMLRHLIKMRTGKMLDEKSQQEYWNWSTLQASV